MLTKLFILTLALPTFLTLSTGMAHADGIDVQNGNTRVTIDQQGGIRINSGPGGAIVLRRYDPLLLDRQMRRSMNLPTNLPTASSRSINNSSITGSMQCSSSSEEHSSGSRTGGSYTYSSSTTQTCH